MNAGNLTGDGAHTYLYDREGNLRCVDGCTKGSNLYDAFDRRVFHHMAQYGDKVERYEYNEDGQISDIWCNDNRYECQSRYYANGENFAYWLAGPQPDLSQQSIHFQHNDYLGTVHARTYDTGAPPGNPSAAREGTYYSLPFGDGKSYAAGNQSPGGTDDSNAHFAELEHDQLDIYSDTDQALNRTYVAAQGSWLQPDPYDGSYDNSDPQSFNRYSYVQNNPLMYTDPSGQFLGLGAAGSLLAECLPYCAPYVAGVVGAVAAVGYGLYEGLKSIFGFNKPHCDACLSTRPGRVWTEGSDFYVPKSNIGSVGGILNSAGVGNAGCGFGGCGFQQRGGTPTYKSPADQAFNFSWFIPLWPLTGTAGVGPAGSITYIPKDNLICASIGGSVGAGKEISAGSLWSSAKEMVSNMRGWSLSGAAILPTPIPVGVQGSTSLDGKTLPAGGVVAGVPGANAALTYGGCATARRKK